MKKKFGIIGIALVLALMASLGFGGTAVLADGTKVTVDFEGMNPDITISSHFVGAHGLEEGMSLFTLDGASYAIGCITASAGGSAEVSGWFDAENGDFDSLFASYMSETGSPNNWHVTQEGYSEHYLSAIGVTNLHVEGGALSTSYNNTETPSAGQLFVGEADSVTASGVSLLRWDSNHDGNLDSSYGAFIELFVNGVEPISFDGYTESSRSLYPDCFRCFGTAHPDEGSLSYHLYSGDADSLIADLLTNYSHTEVHMTPLGLWGVTSAQ